MPMYYSAYQMHTRTNKFLCLVCLVPYYGTRPTLAWYGVYHSKVRGVPTSGITNRILQYSDQTLLPCSIHVSGIPGECIPVVQG